MPNWIKNVTTVERALLLAIVVGAIMWLALDRLIDGPTALAALILVTGTSAGATVVTERIMDHAENNGAKTSDNANTP